jgi:hypothetical protein
VREVAVKDLTANMQYVRDHRDELLDAHRNKFLLVFQGALFDSFDTYQKAVDEGIRRFGLDGDFLVHQMLEKDPVNLIVGAAF